MVEISSFNPNGFTLTEAAEDHLRKNLNSKSSGIGIRFSVEETSGCSGYSYSLDYVEQSAEEDLIFESNDLKVYIDPGSFVYLKGTKVDFVTEGVNEGIKFHNPNVKAVCGCGESFEVNT